MSKKICLFIFLIFFSIFLISPPSVKADFTYGNKSQINAQTGDPIVLSHKTVDNTKLLVVGIMTKATTARTGGAPTYNGVAMTQVGSTMVGATECTAELWFLSAPSIGDYNVSVPNTGAATVTVIASSYVDAGATGAALDVYNSTSTTEANPVLNVTTTSNGEVLVDVFGSGSNTPATANNQTLLYKTDEGVWGSHAQYALQASAGFIGFKWTVASSSVAFILGAFKGVVAGAQNSRNVSLTLSLSDSSSKSFTGIRISSSVLSMSGTTSKQSSLTKSIPLSFSLQSALLKSATSFKMPSTGFSMQAVSSKALGFLKSVSSSLTISSMMSKLNNFYRSLAGVLQLSIASQRAAMYLKSLTSSFSIFSAAQGVTTQIQQKFASLALTLSGNVVKMLNTVRVTTTGFSLNFITSRAYTTMRSVFSSLSLSGMGMRISSFYKSIASSLSISSVAGKFSILLRTLPQGLSLNAMAGRFVSLTKSIQLSIQLQGMTAKLISALRSSVSSLSLSGLVTKTQTLMRSLSQPLSLSSIVSRISSLRRIATASFNLQIMSARVSLFFKNVMQGLQLNAISTKLTSMIRLFTQPISLSLSAIRNQLLTVKVFSSFSLSSMVKATALKIYSATASLMFSVTGAITKMLNSLRTSTASLQISSMTVKLISAMRSVTTGFSLSGLSSRAQTFVKSLTQSLNLFSITTRLSSFMRNISSAFSMGGLSTKLLSLIRIPLQPISLSLSAIRNQLLTVKVFSSFSLSSMVKATALKIYEITASLMFSVTGAITKMLSAVRSSIASLSINLVVNRFSSLAKSVQGSFSLSAITSKIVSFTRIVQSSLQLQTISKNLLSRVRLAATSFSITGITTRIASITKSLTQALQLSAVSQRISSFFRSMTSTFSISSVAGAVASKLYTEAVGLMLSISSAMTKALNVVRSSAIGFSLSSITSRIGLLYKSSFISISLQSISSRAATIFERLSQPLSLQLMTQKIYTAVRSIASSLSLSSVTARMASFIRALGQFTYLSSSVSRAQTLLLKVFSSFSLSSMVKATALKIYSATASLMFSVTGTATRVFTGFRSLSQAVNVTAITARVTSFLRILILSLNFLFSLFKQKTEAPIFSSITVYVDAYTVEMANATNVTNTTIEVLSNETVGNVDFNTTLYHTSPVSNISVIALKYVNLTVSSNLNQTNLTWSLVKIYYSDEELSSLGLDENSLSMYRYDTSLQTWDKLTTGLSFVYGTGVNTSWNYVWANLTSFSLYAAGGLKANGQYCSASTECYSGLCCSGVCQSACPTGIVQEGGGGGFGGGLPIVAPPTEHIEFSKISVLREIVPGRSAVIGITVKNKEKSSMSGLHVEVSGIPKEWVTVVPERLNLNPGETGGFTIGVSVPDVVAPGDYKVVVTLRNQNVEDRSFFILRVKSYAKEEEMPVVMRIVEIDRLGGKTNVELNVYNPSRDWSDVEVVEYIPKAIANSTDIIDFKTAISEIIQKDPIVSWKIPYLSSGETEKIYYSVSNILDEFTPYIYWPLRELSLSKTRPASNLEIVSINIPTLYPGGSSLATLTIKNLDINPHRFGFEFRLPEGWTEEPRNISEVVKGGETREFRLSITVPEKTMLGYYVIRGIFTWDESISIKEYGVSVMPFSYLVLGIIISIIIVVGIVVVYLYVKRMRERGYMARRLESVKRVVGG